MYSGKQIGDPRSHVFAKYLLLELRTLLGPYCGLIPRVLRGPRGLGVFLWVRHPRTAREPTSLQPPPTHRAIGTSLNIVRLIIDH